MTKLLDHECFYDGIDLSDENNPQVVCACGNKKPMPILEIKDE